MAANDLNQAGHLAVISEVPIASEGEFVRIITRGLPAAAAALLALAGMAGVTGTAAAMAAARAVTPRHLTGPAPTEARGGVPARTHGLSPTAVKAHPRPTKAGAGRAIPHTVNVKRLAKTTQRRAAAPAGRTFAPRFSLTTPNGATITSEFDGTTAASSHQTGGLPTRPDASSATNGSQIVEVSNNFIQFFDNNGATMCGTGTGLPLTTFLQTSDQLGAPEIQFDNFQGHFIASVPVESFVSTSIPALYVLISNTSNPCGDWHFYRMTFGGGPYAPGNRLDSVIMGQDRNAVLFETNIFSSSQQFQAYSIFPIDKADLYANNGVSFPAFTVGSQAAPVVNAGEPMISSSSAYFLGADPQIGYQLYRMSGSGTVSPSVTLQATIGAPYSGPQQAVTPPPSVGLNAGDGRMHFAAGLRRDQDLVRARGQRDLPPHLSPLWVRQREHQHRGPRTDDRRPVVLL